MADGGTKLMRRIASGLMPVSRAAASTSRSRRYGAEIGEDKDAQPEEASLFIERKLGARCVITALIVGDEPFRAVLLPFQRPGDLAARPHHPPLLGVHHR